MFITFHSFLLIGTITYKHSDRKCSLYSCVSSSILEYLYCIYKTFSLTQQIFNRLEIMLIQHHVLSLNTIIVLTFPFLSCYMYLIYILKQWIVSFTCSDWLSHSGYPVLLTDLTPGSEQQVVQLVTCNSGISLKLNQMVF